MALYSIPRKERGILATALVITRRELRDSLRDWRILTPIIILTLIFPFIMDFTSRVSTNWVEQYTEGNTLLVDRLNPFLLMIVGFFPISFSLVIALESFVGEKERNSLEPILSMPVTDLELYLGKMLSSLTLPLLASYLGITVFLISRSVFEPVWIPPWELLLLMFLLTTVEALVMVSGAVVISSQTTSVRAANLLASFIIIPMAFLVQAESVIMFYANYDALWWVLFGLIIVDLILIRMGMRIFNREEILSKELDELSLKSVWRDFNGYFNRPPELATERHDPGAGEFNLLRFYKHDIPMLIKQQAQPFAVIMLGVVASIVIGIYLAGQYPLPAKTLPLNQITNETFDNLRRMPILGSINTGFIFRNNVRVILLSGVASLFSFGSLTLLLTLINGSLVSYLVSQVVMLGYNPWLFFGAFILPHGIIEIPAILLGFTFALRIGVGLVAPPDDLDIGQGLLLTTANYLKVLIFLVAPMLLLSAFIEANITPQIVMALYAQ